MDEDELYNTIHKAVRDALEHRGNPIFEAAYFLAFLFFAIAAVDYLSYARWLNKLRYSIWYTVDSSEVQQPQDKPASDCDFLKAPIGIKGCHYEKTVTYQHIIASRDTNTNRSIVSYDEGKTWSWNDGDYPVSPGKTVLVTWQKIEE